MRKEIPSKKISKLRIFTSLPYFLLPIFLRRSNQEKIEGGGTAGRGREEVSFVH